MVIEGDDQGGITGFMAGEREMILDYKNEYDKLMDKYEI